MTEVHTKKALQKWAKAAAATAAWATNVGNEKGEVLISVLTSSESIESLQDMVDGLVYCMILVPCSLLLSAACLADVSPPTLTYTDQECSSGSGTSTINRLFSGRPHLEMCLDIFHFMRRLDRGCRTESHPLYGIFMSRLSGYIFERDPEDYSPFLMAKIAKLKASCTFPASQASH